MNFDSCKDYKFQPIVFRNVYYIVLNYKTLSIDLLK